MLRCSSLCGDAGVTVRRPDTGQEICNIVTATGQAPGQEICNIVTATGQAPGQRGVRQGDCGAPGQRGVRQTACPAPGAAPCPPWALTARPGAELPLVPTALTTLTPLTEFSLVNQRCQECQGCQGRITTLMKTSSNRWPVRGDSPDP
jgi:hypothetical protein